MNKQQEEQNQKLKMQKSPSKEGNNNNNAAAPPRTASKEAERHPAESSHSDEAISDERNGMPIAWVRKSTMGEVYSKIATVLCTLFYFILKLLILAHRPRSGCDRWNRDRGAPLLQV